MPGSLFLQTLRLAEEQGLLARGACAGLVALDPRQLERETARLGKELALRTGGVLIRSLPAEVALSLEEARTLLGREGARVEDLCTAFERDHASILPKGQRRERGLYYTPPETAARVAELALSQGSVAADDQGLSVFDPCAGAGLMLVAAARALVVHRGPRAALQCSGADLHQDALHLCRAALALLLGPHATAAELRGLRLTRADSLRKDPPAPVDLLITNPPYGHLIDAAERAFLTARLPALRGGEVDRYAAFLLRSLELVRPGGTAALLVPDTWMTNARSGPLRSELLERAELAAVADLGKPFASARDTRVQAVVLVRREAKPARAKARTTYAARASAGALGPLQTLGRIAEATLRAERDSGWHPYRTPGEQALCDALERASVPLGEVCEVGYGLRTGDNPTHVARRPPRSNEVGLCGGEDVEPYALRWRPKALTAATPALLALAAKQLGRPRVVIQRIRTNSSAPWARWLEAAFAGPEQVGLDSLSTLAIREGTRDPDGLLLALLGLFGSVAMERAHRLRTTDVNVKPSALRTLPVPRALLDVEKRSMLVRLVRQRIANADANAHLLDRAIDRAVYALYGLPPALVRESEHGFWGDRFPSEYPLLANAARPPSPPMSDPFARVSP